MKTILIIDDTILLLDMNERRLTKLGYKCIKAVSGSEAIDIYKEQYNDIDGIFLDMRMPEMSGKECAEILLQINPNAKIIICSGNLYFNYKEIGAIAALYKPFTIEEMQEVLKLI